MQERYVNSITQSQDGTLQTTVARRRTGRSDKTALLEALCKGICDRYQLAVVTNDTKEDQDILTDAGALEAERIV
ncbi:MAG: Urease accessory protein UreG [Sodalis sp.]|nr:MAG: Urease accessory protein UreG [Sodalis sp.]